MKNFTASARVETSIKNEAEDILQIALTLPAEPETTGRMSENELNARLSHSYAQAVAGEGRPMDEVFDDLEKKLFR